LPEPKATSSKAVKAGINRRRDNLVNMEMITWIMLLFLKADKNMLIKNMLMAPINMYPLFLSYMPFESI
jgi:hypothetical protein